MTGQSAETAIQRCPTCGAQQAATALECRRCHSDLSLLVAVREQLQVLHHLCLRQLATARPEQALEFARLRHGMCPDETSRRLLAVTLLRLGRFAEAAALTADD